MSAAHPIVAVTGSSGAGTSSVKASFAEIFEREGIRAAIIEGDSFHRYDRAEMQAAIEAAEAEGRNLTHFGPEGNLFGELEELFHEYSRSGAGRRRRYIHTEEEAWQFSQAPGTFTAWEPIPPGTDLLFYEGLHGGLVTERHNIARWCDLLIGVAPIINLEWIQKIQRDKWVRGYSAEDATRMILSRMHDYVHYITPQFSLTDINFQRVPTIDTSNPFAADHIPTDEESAWVIHLRNKDKFQLDMPRLLLKAPGTFLSREDTLVVPGIHKNTALEIIVTPEIRRLIEHRKRPSVAVSNA